MIAAMTFLIRSHSISLRGPGFHSILLWGR
jgi:hypothetical protein